MGSFSLSAVCSNAPALSGCCSSVSFKIWRFTELASTKPHVSFLLPFPMETICFFFTLLDRRTLKAPEMLATSPPFAAVSLSPADSLAFTDSAASPETPSAACSAAVSASEFLFAAPSAISSSSTSATASRRLSISSHRPSFM